MVAESIHGHAVIEMVVASGRRWGRQELIDRIAQLHGPSARFHTCSAQDLSAEGLVAFLDAKGKFLETEEGLAFDASKLCGHSDAEPGQEGTTGNAR
jgi:probable metal-binding protein